MVAAGAGAACDVREFARSRGAKLRLSIATGQVGGTYYVLGGGLAKVLSEHVPNVQVTAEATAASVDNLKFLRAGQVDLGLVIGPSLADAYRGADVFRDRGPVPVRALASLYTQPMHAVTLVRHGIARIADLRGRVVSTQSPGSGTDVVARRMLEAAGVDPGRDLVLEHLGPSQAIDALKDGKIDALFSSAGIPQPAIVELGTTIGGEMRLLPSDDVLPALHVRHGAVLYPGTVIPAGTYPGQRDAIGTVGSVTLLAVDQKLGETLAYEITRVVFDHAAEIAAVHPIAKGFTPARGAALSPIPFHPGAERFYRERGAWPS